MQECRMQNFSLLNLHGKMLVLRIDEHFGIFSWDLFDKTFFCDYIKKRRPIGRRFSLKPRLRYVLSCISPDRES